MGAYNEKKKASNKKWNDAHMERVTAALPKGTKDRIKKAARDEGISVNRFIGLSIAERLQKVEKSELSEEAATHES